MGNQVQQRYNIKHDSKTRSNVNSTFVVPYIEMTAIEVTGRAGVSLESNSL